LLEGAPPNVIQSSVIGRHQQTWKLREHLLVTTDSDSDSGIELDLDSSTTVNSLNPGDPLDAYFPAGTEIREYWDGLTVQEPGCDRPLRYQRFSANEAQKRDIDDVQDIIITGEVGTKKKSLYLQMRSYMMYLRDIRPGVSATLSDGFDLVMDLLVFAKNMFVFLLSSIVVEVEPPPLSTPII
jgi:hypothetical protein